MGSEDEEGEKDGGEDGGGGEVFGGCGGCGGCGGDTGGMSGGKKNSVSKLSLKVTFTLSIFHKC